ncbi:hypothetical protein ACS0TY_027587 [Phlomoides rotata]
MCSCGVGVGHQVSGSEPLRLSFLHSARPNPPPNLISFRFRHASSIRATLNDTVSGGPPAAMTFYDLLGIPETGSILEIKQAYKQLARKYHPDVSPPDRVEEFTQTFIRVHEAYETLSDPRRRELYDRHMAKGLHLAFVSRRRSKFDDQEVEDKDEWKSRWQSQLSELKKRSMHKESGDNMSWGARIRKERNHSSS